MADEQDTKRGSRFERRFTFGFIFLICFAQLFYYEATFKGFDDRWIDSLFRWRGVQAADPRMVVVAIDDNSIKRIGQYPWPRSVYERLLDKLYAAGVKVVGLDILFLDPSRPEEDLVLMRATQKAGKKLVHAFMIDPGIREAIVFQYPFPGLKKAAKSLGFVNQTILDGDGAARVTPLAIEGFDPGKEDGEPERKFSLGLKVLSEYLGKDPNELLTKFPGIIRLNIRGQKKVKGGSQTKHGVVQEIENDYFGIRRIAAWQVLENTLDDAERKALKGGIVLVGSTAIAAFDHYPTPFSESTPGVEVHANAIDNLLNDRYLRGFPELMTLGLIILMAFLALLYMRLGPVQAGLAMLATLAAWMLGTYASFRALRVFDFTAPATALLGNFVVLIVHKTVLEQRNKKQMEAMFGQYVDPDVVKDLIKSGKMPELGGKKKDMTIFFLDIAHFTNISEKLTPENLILFLNEYLTVLSDIVWHHKGSVDKYIGDCVMAFFNAPNDVPDHRARACLAAVECIEAIDKLNREYKGPALSEMPAIRIGLNSGEVVVGNTGSNRKKAYTVLGDEVNLASRLEGANKFFGSKIMASESTYLEAKDAVEGRVLGAVRVVGKAIPIRVYELLGKKGQLSPQWSEALPHYEKGVALYLKRDFEGAKAEFDAVLKLIPDDKPTKLYASVCDDYALIPPPADWDGVFNLTAK